MPELVLAIDTSLEYCSVAIGSSTECLYRFSEHAPRGHSERRHAFSIYMDAFDLKLRAMIHKAGPLFIWVLAGQVILSSIPVFYLPGYYLICQQKNDRNLSNVATPIC